MEFVTISDGRQSILSAFPGEMSSEFTGSVSSENTKHAI